MSKNSNIDFKHEEFEYCVCEEHNCTIPSYLINHQPIKKVKGQIKNISELLIQKPIFPKHVILYQIKEKQFLLANKDNKDKLYPGEACLYAIEQVFLNSPKECTDYPISLGYLYYIFNCPIIILPNKDCQQKYHFINQINPQSQIDIL